MDEKTAMTVEFLRARLLSERIVSKTARQRTEMLSQRVIELEEQLRMVNIHRRKAEKAAEEVLSILDTQGMTCISGLTDSGTDQENNQVNGREGNQCIISKDVIKEDKFLSSSRIERSEVDNGFSCSDVDGSSSDYNSLSWKSHGGGSIDSQEKLKTKQSRHKERARFISSLKSSSRRPGKSCRKIKRADAGSASDKESQKPTLVHAHGDGVVSHSDDFDEKHECPLEASGSKMDKSSVDSSLSFFPDNQNKEKKNGGGIDDMERALEQQAQLIIQFQAMENAQKEWEEKFNETNMSVLDTLEPVNQPNDSVDKSKLIGLIPQQQQEDKISFKDISFTEDKNSGSCRNCEVAVKKITSDNNFSAGLSSSLSPSSPSRNGSNGLIQTVSKALLIPPQNGSDLSTKVILGSNSEKSNTVSARNLKVNSQDQVMSSPMEFSAPNNRKIISGLEEPVIRETLMEQQYDARKDLRGSIYENPTQKVSFPDQGMLHSSSAEKLNSITDEKVHNKQFPEAKELRRLIPRPTKSSLGSVLESLQRARISIKQELVKRPESARGAERSPSKPPDIPIDSSALFRLPSDSFPRALSGPNIYGSRSRLTATRPNLEFENSTDFTVNEYLNQFPATSYAQPGSKVSFSNDYVVQHPLSPYREAISRVQVQSHHPVRFIESESHVSTVKDYSDRRSNSSLSTSSASGFPLYYPDLFSKRLSFQNEISESSSDMRIRKPYSDGYSYGRTSPSPI